LKKRTKKLLIVDGSRPRCLYQGFFFGIRHREPPAWAAWQSLFLFARHEKMDCFVAALLAMTVRWVDIKDGPIL
jgi:hypothetical protein